MRYACATELYGVKDVLYFVTRPSSCDPGEKLVEFKKEYPVFTCRKNHGTPRGVRSPVRGKKGAHSRGPAGLMRLVGSPTNCKPDAQPNETALTLPATKKTKFCVHKKSRELRWINRARCTKREFRADLPAFKPPTPTTPTTPTTPDPPPNNGNDGNVKANADSASTDEDSTKGIDVLANDTVPGPGNKKLTIASLDTAGTKGNAAVNGDGAVTYDPNGKFESLAPGETATDTFKYRAKTDTHTSDPATVTVTVSGVNDAPVLASIESSNLNYFEGAPKVEVTDALTVSDVDNADVHHAQVKIGSGFDQGNDELDSTDANGITSTYDSGTGVLTLTGSASKADYETALRSVTFSSTGGASGARAISFQVDDGASSNHESNVEKRDVVVDKAPNAVDDSKTLTEDDSATTIDVASNDTDSDGGPNAITSKTDGANGTVAITNGGEDLTYTPNANFCGADSFTYTLNGGSTGTVSVTVDCVNDAPVNTVPGAQNIDEDGTIDFTAADFQVEDVDAGGGTITTTLSIGDGALTIGGSGGTVTGDGTNSVEIKGTLTEVNSRLDDVKYAPATDDSGNDTLTVATDDGGNSGAGGAKDDSDTVGVTVSAVNDAPNVTVPGAQSTDEDTTLTLTGANAPAVSDVDAGSDAIKVTVGVANGTLTVDPGSGATALGDGTGSVELTGTTSQVNDALDGLEYTPNAHYNGSDALSVDADDLGNNGSGGAQTDSSDFAITVGAVNDAPVNTVPGAQSTDEDTPLTLSGANALSISDEDSGGGQVKVLLEVAHGTLSAGVPSGGSRSGDGTGALELTGDVSSINSALNGGLVYTPAAGYDGADTLNMTTSDEGHTGSGGAKTDIDTVGIAVGPVNDAPVLTVPGAQSTNEDTALTLSGANAPSVADSDVGSGDVRVTLAVSNGAVTVDTTGLDFGCGSCSGDGAGDATMSFQGTVAEVNSALDGLSYQGNLNEDSSDSLSITVSDQGNSGSGGAKSDSDSVAIDLLPVNDAPSATADGYSVDEDTTLSVPAAGLLANDSDVDGDSLTAAEVTDAANGDVTVNSDGAFVYIPDTNFNGADSFTYKANDGSADSNTVTVSITVNAVNDAPINTVPTGKTVNEDQTLTLSAGDAPSISDTEATSAQVTLSAGSGTLTLNGTDPDVTVSGNGSKSVVASGPIGDINTLLNGLAYTPDSNVNGADTITLTTSDLGASGSGGTKTDQDSVGITIDPVNDAPVATGDTLSTDEDTAKDLAVLANDSDVENDTLTPSIVTFPTKGNVVVNANGTIAYTPNANETGGDSFTYKVNDGALDSNTVTVNLTITAINDAPVNTVPGTQTINEDSNLVLSGGNAPIFADVDDGGATDMKVTLTATGGTLTLGSTANLVSVTGNGTGTVVATGAESDLNNAMSGLTYNPTGNFNGTGGITVKSEDNGNTGTGGNKSDTDSIQVNVVAQNDGPINSVPGSQTTDEDTPKSFSSAGGNALSIGDIDSDPDDVSITLNSTNGIATLNPAATGALATLTGDGTNTVTATGTVAELNAALDGLVFTPTLNHFGSASLQLVTSDDGNNGDGGTLTDSDTVSITVNSVNDGPVAFAPETASTNEDTQHVFSPVPTVTDVDSGADDLRVTVSVTKGRLTLATTAGITSIANGGDGQDDATITFEAPVAAANNALNGLKYTPNDDFNGGDSLSLTVNDLGHNGSGLNLASSDSTTITIGAVNDAPLLDLNGSSLGGTGTSPIFLETVTHDNSVTLAPQASITDVDDTHIESATITLTNRPNGNSEALSVNTSGTDIVSDGYNPATGVLFLHGSAPKADYAQVLQTVAYSNSVTIPDAADRNVTFTVNDGNADSAAATSTVQVVPLNTPPVVDLDTTNPASSDSAATFTEDSPAVNIAPSPDIADADAFDSHMESATITLTNRPDGANETLTTDVAGTSGITVTPYDSSTGVLALNGHGTIGDYETLISRIKYDNTSQNPNETDRDITVVVNDGQANSITRHAIVEVNRHNDQIVNTVPGGQTTDEDTAITFTTGNLISIDDPDAGSGSVSVTISAANGSLSADVPADGGGRSGNGTHTLVLAGTVSAINDSLDGMTYTPDANHSTGDTITVLSDDNGNTGGTATTDSDTIAVTTNAVNDAPVNTVPGSQTVNEDETLTFSSANGNALSVSDGDAGSNPIQVTLTATKGAITLPVGSLPSLSFTTGDGTGDATMTFTGTQASINGALNGAEYLGTLNENGAAQLTIITNDQGHSGSGVALSDTDVVGITITPVNDAPSAANDTHSTSEDTQLNVGAPGVLGNDSDIDTPSGSLTATKVSNPAHGSVTVNSNGSFTYTPSQDYNGADSFTYKVSDGSLDSNTATVNITVNAVNDAPQNTVPGSQQVDEDTTLTFLSGNGNAVNTSDVDAGSGSTVRVTLSVLHGGITLPVTTGLSFACAGCAGDGTGDSTMTFEGTLATVQARLSGLQYQGTLNYNGPEQLTVTVNDKGNTPAPAEQDSDTVNITVNPVNDVPTADAETFGGTPATVNEQATGNTTFQVDDPTDNKSAPTNPHSEISGDILDGDDDVDGPGPLIVQSAGSDAGATNGQTADGGTVTVEQDGDFVYQPPASVSCDNGTDSFNYKISDQANSGAGPIPGSAIGTVTIHLEGCVWYVNNNAPGNAGTATQPFDTLAQGETASGNNHTTFVYDGDNTSTGYQTGYAMNSGERLIGEHEGLTVDPDQGGSMTADSLHPANAGAHPTLSGTNEDVIDLDDGNEVRGFNLNPTGTGSGIAATSGDTGGATIDDVNVVDTAVAGSQPLVELDSASGTFNFSNLVVNNQAATSPPNTAKGVRINLPAAGSVFDFDPGSQISIGINGAAGLDVDGTAGNPVNLGTSTFDDITVAGSSAGGVSITHASGTKNLGDGTGTDLNLTTTSGSTPAFELNNAGTTTVASAGSDDVHATGGPAIDVTGTSGPTLEFDDVDSTNSANDGINIDGLGTGTFSATSGDIGGAAGISVDLNGGNGAISYPGNINNGSGTTAIEVTGRTGGSGVNGVTLSGPIQDTNDNGGGINVASNTGGQTTISNSTKQFNTGTADGVVFNASDGHTLTLSGGGLDIDTTSGNGVNATTSGTLEISGSGNTIDSSGLSASNRGLNVADTDIAAADVTFQRISTSGGINGIRLNNTGNSAGALSVASSGSGAACGGGVNTATAPATVTAPVTSDCTGGTIQSTSESGIALSGVPGSVSLTRVRVHAAGDDGITGTNVDSGFVLSNGLVSSSGNAVGDRGLDFANVKGTSSIATSTVTGSAEDNVRWENTDGSLALTVSGSTMSSNSASSGGDGMLLRGGTGSPTMTANVTGNLFQHNRDDGFQVANSTPSSAQMHATFSNNDIVQGVNNAPNNAALSASNGSNADTRFKMDNNDLTGSLGGLVILNPGPDGTSASSFDAIVTNNRFGGSTVDSGSVSGIGLWGRAAGNGVNKFEIRNNTLRHYQQQGMYLRGNEGTGQQTHYTVTGNSILDPDGTGFRLLLEAGSNAGDATSVCADIGGAGGLANTIDSNGSPADIGVARDFAANTLSLTGYGGGDLSAYFNGRNTGSPAALTAVLSNLAPAGGGACSLPATPLLP